MSRDIPNSDDDGQNQLQQDSAVLRILHPQMSLARDADAANYPQICLMSSINRE